MNIYPTTLSSYCEYMENGSTETTHNLSVLVLTDDPLLAGYLNERDEGCVQLTAYFRQPNGDANDTFELVFDNSDDGYLVMPFDSAHSMLTMLAMLQQIPHAVLTCEWLVQLGFSSEC